MDPDELHRFTFILEKHLLQNTAALTFALLQTWLTGEQTQVVIYDL